MLRRWPAARSRPRGSSTPSGGGGQGARGDGALPGGGDGVAGAGAQRGQARERARAPRHPSRRGATGRRPPTAPRPFGRPVPRYQDPRCRCAPEGARGAVGTRAERFDRGCSGAVAGSTSRRSAAGTVGCRWGSTPPSGDRSTGRSGDALIHLGRSEAPIAARPSRGSEDLMFSGGWRLRRSGRARRSALLLGGAFVLSIGLRTGAAACCSCSWPWPGSWRRSGSDPGSGAGQPAEPPRVAPRRPVPRSRPGSHRAGAGGPTPVLTLGPRDPDGARLA